MLSQANHFKLLIAQIQIRNATEDVLRLAKAEKMQSERVRLVNDFRHLVHGYMEKLSRETDKMGSD